jgi:energy-converting hydrogenase Eha subunit B
MTAAAGLTVYAAIGLVAGLVAAIREYQDGSLPGDSGSAGAVGFFTACFWPIVGLVVVLGVAAHGIVRIVRFIESTRPK